jgi:superfamily II DNA or RNA helicase
MRERGRRGWIPDGRNCFPPMNINDARSGTHNENIQEVIDAAVSASHALQGGQQQYQSPEWLARGLAAMLPYNYFADAYDPQCAGGNLVNALPATCRYGTELDRRFMADEKAAVVYGEVDRITGSCVHIMQTMDELYPSVKFSCIVANPPFGIRWKLKDGETIDSTEWTWKMIEGRIIRGGCGFLISNYKTLERLKITEHPNVYLYQRFPGGGIWDDCNVELGIVHFYFGDAKIERRDHVWDRVPSEKDLVALAKELKFPYIYRPYNASGPGSCWGQLKLIIREEGLDRPKYNIYLNKEGMLRTYLSTRAQIKIDRDEIAQLSRINNCHPLTLTTERETRKLLQTYLSGGVYTIEPAARKAIADALAEVASLACPIRPVTEFELVAYTDEEEELKCIGLDPTGKIRLTVGKRYEVRTGTYTFKDKFTRKKIYYDEETEKTEIEDHDCELSGEDRYIEITDDNSRIHRFMERPVLEAALWQHQEELLWQLFAKPYVPSIAEVDSVQYERNKNAMRFNEMLAGFTYFPGQLDYYARMACKDYGLIAAETGSGKSLGALTVIALKSPKRTLLIAPQGTMRSVGEEDEVDYQASQWVKEIQRFAPGEPVFQLFCRDDWKNILYANGGKLPNGIYITYPQAYFSNGAFEHIPDSWGRETEKKFCDRYDLPFSEERPMEDHYSRNVGATHAKKGIRCVAEASLATQIAAVHGEAWDMVILDEAHLICNVESNISRNMFRLQPKYRFAMTATPIPNIITNIFSLMGWLCVKDWHKGGMRNAAWPYSVDEIGRFNHTFLSTESDLTAQHKARARGKRGWRNVGVRFSPVISSPARLLKLLKPTLAYISKADCNPNLNPCEVIDVRVALGKEQSKLYAYWLERKHYMTEFKNPLTIAQVQSSRLRGVCAAPASLDYTRGMCKSNFNPKTVTILQLVRDCLRRGEQVVIVSARVGQSTALAARLSDAGVPVSRIDSTVAAELHTAEANRFKKGDARVMLMGIKCAQGHSFDQCPNLIVGSLEWSYGTLNQAQGRVWRLTSPKPVKIWVVLHENTIEELLFDRVALKQDAATLCLHGKRVPRDFKTLDASEVLAEHIVNYSAADGDILSESECESQWTDLRKQLVMANRPKPATIARLEDAA